MDTNLVLSTTSIVAIAAIVITIATLFKKEPEEYEGGEGDPIIDPPEEREKEEEKEKTYATKALGYDCWKDSDCSATGRFGGRASGPLDRIHCDTNRCQYDRKDYSGVFWFPPSKCKGGLFERPGTCPMSGEESELRKKIEREGNVESKGVGAKINLNSHSERNDRLQRSAY